MPRLPCIPPGDLSARNRIMVSMLDWKTLPLNKIPDLAKKALMAHQSKEPPDFTTLVERLGGPRTKIGIVCIPMTLLRLQVMNDPNKNRDFECFEQYHREYIREEKKAGIQIPAHKTRWPIILSGVSWPRETIVDGWHRFHSYHRSGIKNLDALWYADN